MTDSKELAVNSHVVVKTLAAEKFVLDRLTLLGKILGLSSEEYTDPVVPSEPIATKIDKILNEWKSAQDAKLELLCKSLTDMDCNSSADKIKNQGGDDVAAFNVIEILSKDSYFCKGWKIFVHIIGLDACDFEPTRKTNFEMVMDIMTKWKSKANAKASVSQLSVALRKLNANRCAGIIEGLVAEKEKSALPNTTNVHKEQGNLTGNRALEHAAEASRNVNHEYVMKQEEINHSYEKVFGPVLTENVGDVALEDPFIRTAYQINNFKLFINLLQKKCPQLRTLLLTTKYHENKKLRKAQMESLSELTNQLGNDKKGHKKIILDVKYDNAFHNRLLWIDNHWKVHLDRGLDYFYKGQDKIKEKSEEWNNLDIRKCAKCTMSFYKMN